MVFAIRDDDTSFYTMPSELLSAYEGNEDIPISLSIVPYAAYLHGEEKPYTSIKCKTEKYPPIHKNEELVKYILENKTKYEVLLHGINHEYQRRGSVWIPEMLWKSEESLKKELPEAKKYLEVVFQDDISVFVAPSNWMDAKVFRLLDQLGLNTMCCLSKKVDHPVTIEYIRHYITRNINKVIGKGYFGVKKYRNHAEVECFSVTDAEDMWKNYLLCKQNKQPYIIYTHYWELNRYPEMKKALTTVIKKMLGDGAEARFVSECFNME